MILDYCLMNQLSLFLGLQIQSRFIDKLSVHAQSLSNQLSPKVYADLICSLELWDFFLFWKGHQLDLKQEEHLCSLPILEHSQFIFYLSQAMRFCLLEFLECYSFLVSATLNLLINEPFIISLQLLFFSWLLVDLVSKFFLDCHFE